MRFASSSPIPSASAALDACVHDFVYRPEFLHQRELFFLAYALDLRQHGSEVALGMETSEIGDGKSVGFVADALEHFEHVIPMIDPDAFARRRVNTSSSRLARDMRSIPSTCISSNISCTEES